MADSRCGSPASRCCSPLLATIYPAFARVARPAGRSAAVRVSMAAPTNGSSARATCARRIAAASCRSSRSMSVIGLALGVAMLIVVLSVMNGFERELRSRMLTVTSHATLMGLDGALADWRAGAAAAREAARRASPPCPTSSREALLANGKRVAGAMVRGVLPEEEAQGHGLAQRLTPGRSSDLQAGELPRDPRRALARELGVKVGDTVVLMAPEGTRDARRLDAAHAAASRRAASSSPACTSSTAGSRSCT